MQPDIEQPFLKAVSALLELVKAFSEVPPEKLEELKGGIPKLLNVIDEIRRDKQEQAERDRIFDD